MKDNCPFCPYCGIELDMDKYDIFDDLDEFSGQTEITQCYSCNKYIQIDAEVEIEKFYYYSTSETNQPEEKPIDHPDQTFFNFIEE